MGKLSGLKEGLEKAAKALDMSQAARMQRAAEQGFDTGKVWYHGSGKSGLTEITPGYNEPGAWFAESQKLAGNYAKEGHESLYSVHLKSEKPLIVNFEYDYSRENPLVPYVDGEELQIRDMSNVGIVEYARRKGYDSVEFPNGNFTEDGFTKVVFDGSQIRSTEAAFDPAQKESSNLLAQYAPLATGAGAAGLAISPQESQAAAAQQLASQPVSNAVDDIWQRNLNPVGLNERGVPVTGQMRATPHPLLMQVADKLRMVDTPIGPVFGGAADYLDKLGAGENVDYWDRLGAALDVIP